MQDGFSFFFLLWLGFCCSLFLLYSLLRFLTIQNSFGCFFLFRWQMLNIITKLGLFYRLLVQSINRWARFTRFKYFLYKLSFSIKGLISLLFWLDLVLRYLQYDVFFPLWDFSTWLQIRRLFYLGLLLDFIFQYIGLNMRLGLRVRSLQLFRFNLNGLIMWVIVNFIDISNNERSLMHLVDLIEF